MSEPHDDGLGATLAAGSGSGTEDTLSTMPAPSGPPKVVRGAARDYASLLEVNPAHYDRERELARGGMGRIIVARDRRLGREVAIKEIVSTDEGLRARFEREARITARLQHPSTIALHEAGVWPTGEPFFAMPLVAGRPLDKVIGEAATVEARFGLIANVLAVADTLAYAHDRRIVHRDLKPGNVLVGDFGETVVIDWGLAKDLDSAEESMKPASTSPSSSADATEHGAVIGTPAYMPPEQAEGEPVDERADVYAIGAMLYHVLSGSPPYTGRTAQGVLADVIAGPPRPLGELVPDAPPDLLTIVAKAMARERPARYRTAKELAAELRTFQTGQLVASHRYTFGELLRRWLRKHRTTLAVAGVALLVLAAFGAYSVNKVMRERAAAEAARTVAEQQRTLALKRDLESRNLVRFLLVDFHDKLQAAGKLELLESAASEVLKYYDARGARESHTDQLARAGAITILGDALVSSGAYKKGLEQYENARRMYAEVLDEHSEDIDAALGLGTTADRLAQASYGVDSKRVEVLEQEAIKRLEAVIVRAPERDDAPAIEIGAQRLLGDTLLDTGDAAGATKAYRRGIELAAKYGTKYPDVQHWKRDQAVLHSQYSAVLLMQGDTDAALVEEREDLRLSAELVAAAPKDSTAANDLAGAHLRLGDILLATQKSDAALAEFRSALETMKHLTLLDPTNADWQNDRCECHDRVGKVLLDAKHDTKGARAEFEACLAIRKQVVARDAHSPSRGNLGKSHNKLGNVLETEKKYAAALAEYEIARPIFETLAVEDPNDASRQRDLSVSYFLTADMYLATHRASQALERARKALAIAETLAPKDPTNTQWKADLIDCHIQVGRVLIATRDTAGARKELETAHRLAEAAAKDDATDPQWAQYVKDTTDKLRACCRK